MTLGKARVLEESGAGFPARPIAFTEGRGESFIPKKERRWATCHRLPGGAFGFFASCDPPPSAQGQTPAYAICPQRAKHPSSPLSKKAAVRGQRPFWGRGKS